MRVILLLLMLMLSPLAGAEWRQLTESDDGDVLTGWALDGRGIVLKPVFEVADHLRTGRLVPVAPQAAPLPTQLSLLSQQRSAKDSKVRLFTDFMVARIKEEMRRATLGPDAPV